jgi:hypothetical protein
MLQRVVLVLRAKQLLSQTGIVCASRTRVELQTKRTRMQGKGSGRSLFSRVRASNGDEPLTYVVTVEWVDAYGNFTREKLTVNEALLNILRFARKYPSSACKIELREIDPDPATLTGSRPPAAG